MLSRYRIQESGIRDQWPESPSALIPDSRFLIPERKARA